MRKYYAAMAEMVLKDLGENSLACESTRTSVSARMLRRGAKVKDPVLLQAWRGACFLLIDAGDSWVSVSQHALSTAPIGGGDIWDSRVKVSLFLLLCYFATHQTGRFSIDRCITTRCYCCYCYFFVGFQYLVFSTILLFVSLFIFSPLLQYMSGIDRYCYCYCSIIIIVGPMPMETQSFHKKFELQRYSPENFRYSLLWARFFKPKVPNFLGKHEENYFGADVRPRSASEKLRPMFSLKRRDSDCSTDIDRQNQRLRHEF